MGFRLPHHVDPDHGEPVPVERVHRRQRAHSLLDEVIYVFPYK
jgi:hypothetical protein